MNRAQIALIALLGCLVLTSCTVKNNVEGKPSKRLSFEELKQKSAELEKRRISGYSDLEIEQMIYNKTALLTGYTMKTGLIHQVEYYAPDGAAYLWYPENTTPVKGKWEIKGNKTICFTYTKDSYNPHTKTRGDVPLCKNLADWDGAVVDRKLGDIFNLSSMKLPRVLKRRMMYHTLEQVKSNAGIDTWGKRD